MLDMTFQILFFLIMNFRLPTAEGQKEHQPKEDGKQPTIQIECPKKLKYSELLRVMDIMVNE